MLQKNDIITGEVSGLAFGGQGILRHEGFVIFVPFTAPGDVISCRIIEKKKSFATGEVVDILTPSPKRTKPACLYYGRCGGCQLQHLDYDTQLRCKKSWVEDSIQRIGRMPIDCIAETVPAKLQWCYRRHITLTLVPRNGTYSAGYIEMDNHSLIEVQHCPIFNIQSDPIIQHTAALVGNLKHASQETAKATILKQGNGSYIVQLKFTAIPENCPEICVKALKEVPVLSGIMVSSPAKTVSYGNPLAHCAVDGIEFEFPPDVFIQNHSEQSEKIYKVVCSIAAQEEATRILDLYCGIGITSVLLARQGMEIIGVEYSGEAIRWANKNAVKHNCKNIQFVQADVQKVLSNILKKHKPDFVLVNPPRIGMEPRVTQEILKFAPKNIAYISCMPSTLARDLQSFSNAGYSIVECRPFDMFPQTAHVETVVHLRLKSV